MVSQLLWKRSTRNLVVIATVISLLPITGFAITPKDPKVKAMLEKAITFLENSNEHGPNDSKLGAQCLTGMAILKYRKNVQHPKVQAAIQACQAVAQNPAGSYPTDFNYSLGIAIMFMCDVEFTLQSKEYQSEITALLNMMTERQRQDGAWSYTIPPHPTGDTSQTQYGALSAWFASMQGYEVKRSSVAGYCNWLIRTQDPSGEFAYQGTDPGSFDRIEQPSRKQQPDAAYRMSPAALGAVYIAAKILNIPVVPKQENKSILKDLEPEEEAGTEVDVVMLRRAINEGNRVYDSKFKIDVMATYQYYYLYSVERYFSLREWAEDKEVDEPVWYDQGVDYLSKTQLETGAWNDNTGSTVATGFGALFLMRATKVVIQQNRSGSLRGSIGLPNDLTRINLTKDGQVVSSEVEGDIDVIFKTIEENPDLLDTRSVLNKLDGLILGEKKKPEASKLEELKKLISGEGAGQSYVARMAAVRAIANSEDINNVPVLIYALGDGDNRVVKEANDGLRLISKRLTYETLPAQPSVQQKRTAQDKWYTWLQSVRPDIEVPEDAFLDLSQVQ